MKIGILGGTFDPPHVGHLTIAEAARDQLELDEVLFVPSMRNPLKTRRASSAKDRMEMVRLAISDQDRFAVSDIEIARGGQSYAYDTVAELTYMRPAEYWWIMGSDALKEFEKWKNPDKLSRMCRLAVAVRPPATLRDAEDRAPAWLMPRIDWLEAPPCEMSSTELRLRTYAKKPLSPWVSSPVQNYIQEKKLYLTA